LRIYLIGSISEHLRNGELERATEWRSRLKNRLKTHNIECFDPCVNLQNHLTLSDKSIVLQNIYYLNSCDIGIVNTDKLIYSPGSWFEIFKYYFDKKPVVAFGEKPPTQVPHVREAISEYFKTEEEVVKYLKSLFKQFNE